MGYQCRAYSKIPQSLKQTIVLDDYCLTNTHAMTVVGRPNMCGVSVYSIFQNTTIIEAVWHKLTTQKPSNLESECTRNLAVFGCPYPHKYTCDGSGCVTEYVWGTSVELSPGYFSDCRSSAEVETITPLECRVCVYKREIYRFLAAHILTNTNAMGVVV